MTLAGGHRLGPYEILDYIGRGGMGAVYKAYDPVLTRYVALKVLPAEFLHDPSFADRFRREAQIWARLDHPSIVPVYFSAIEEGLPFLAMKFVSGGALADLLKGGPLDHERTAAILSEIASALDHAHGLGVVHRDVKPGNVLLGEDGRAYLSDFGIARVVAGTRPSTHTGGVTGTPGYMAPEQARSQQPDARVDIYSLGCMAYEMYTGVPPFKGDTPVDVMMRHITESPAPPRSLAPGLSPHIESAILKAIAKDPDHRWPTASLFVQALLGRVDSDGTVSLPGRPFQTPPPIASPAPPSGAALLPWGETPRGLLVAVLVGVTLGAGVLVAVQRYAAAVAPTPLSALGSASSSDTLLAAVRRAMDEGAYPEAFQMVELALRIHPGHEGAQILRERVKRAWEAERSLGLWQAASPSPSPPLASPTP